ncbi:cobalamin biosynthesis protein [Paraburkholderia caledonica]|uniref:cobalamin biosynthesis protein n=1 Tax=Paraburkholderia caledonica TaxID=134536 RepID=UPI000489C1BA|nr:cobalamin biosynthesis protein [Paraburkholderia caledonica]
MKTLSVGIGCRLHTSADEIETAVRAALGSHTFEQIATVASIGTKADEPGLLEFCARHGFALQVFNREQILAIRVHEPSAAAREHLGVDGVCEPCALLAVAAGRTAHLIARKTVYAGVTVAIASTAPAHSVTTIQQDLP